MIRVSSLLAFSLLLISCDADILDQPPGDAITSDEFFNTGADLEAYTNDLYGVLPTKSVYMDDSDSDNILGVSAGDRLRGTRRVPTDRGSGGWSWGHLRRINYFLENYNRVDDAQATAKYSGIAKFFRAYFYFEKVQRFGAVPWYGEVINQDDEELLTKGRDSRQLVMDSIIADIDYAIENIPAEKELNRITKYTALILKARIGLYEGTFRKYHGIDDYERFLEGAASAAKELMDSGAYELYTSGGTDRAYLDLFAMEDQNTTETILAVDYEFGLRTHDLAYRMTAPTQGRWGLAKDLVNSYLMTDGSSFTDQPGYETMEFYEEMQNRDPRLTQTTAGPNFATYGSEEREPVNLDITRTGYRIIKALPPKGPQWGSGGSFNDVILFRYAEALLIYAEARAELGTLTQGDLDISINKLRDRVGLPHLNMAEANANPDSYQESLYENIEGPNKGVILEIRRERRVEMVNEGLRWDDLMRWKEGQKIEAPIEGIYFAELGAHDFNNDGKFDVYVHDGDTSGAPDEVSTMVNINERPLTEGDYGNMLLFEGGNFDENRDYFYPLPLEDLELNDNLEQNPGW
ncbi:RagB/SusD family nutrient uptake outer membrane protein [Salegentibacter sp. BLCTC]|uniref:RagB/SusD family nutrient uptake outer membrane protein n=2 Tax=Flavobacteriaceae TaxID=49546 RepID=A0ABS0TH57_9FLAO|nr:RagB/SusD family nutrient uptake outer membrane protein [Salegentibacter sp. BLCTC]MBI6118149.1 RagB/SusD family nutrient uptake outer membrane protein [Salegentibacter maritimus]MBI6120130.1 RagB/SusD family nutrient uptake outer membrane protein [Salegentibacter maritimus]